MTLPGVGAVLLAGSMVAGTAGLVTTLAQDHGIPERAAVAYITAARNAPCPLDYRILTAVGANETGHGTTRGASIGEDGKLTKPIKGGAGEDGPMQFMPETWKIYATDGDGDGQADVNDIDDATAAAAEMFCANNADESIEEALGNYNGGGKWRNYASAREYVDMAEGRIAALPADDGANLPNLSSGQQSSTKLPDDEGRLCGVGEWLSEQGDCMSEAKAKAAYLWARFGQMLDEGDTERLHAAWMKLNGEPPAATKQQVSAKAPTVKAAKLVEVAKGWVGRQFNPGEREQCAYFVRTALKEAGVTVGVTRQTIDGFSTGEGRANSFGPDQGQLIKDPAQLRPGDIVMFGGTYGGAAPDDITHVGIYVGDGKIVDRSTMEAPVRERPMSTFKYFVGGIRLGVLA